MITPEQAAAKWANRLTGSTEQMRQGAMSVTVSPGAKAAAQKTAYLDGVQRSASKWERNVSKVSLADWQRAYVDKGVNRVASGATAAQAKVQSFQAKWLPHMEAGKRMLESMPRGNKEQNKARMLAIFDHNASFRMS